MGAVTAAARRGKLCRAWEPVRLKNQKNSHLHLLDFSNHRQLSLNRLFLNQEVKIYKRHFLLKV